MLAINSEHRLRSENLPFDIDVWYPALREYSFESVFVPISPREAQAVVRYYRSRFILQEPTLTREDVEAINGLELRVGTALQSAPFGPNGAFVRLCGRSPKDGDPLHRRPVCRKYIAAVHRAAAEAAGGTGEATPPPCNVFDVDVRIKLQAIARVPWMCVTSGAECLNLLLTSERVYADLLDSEQYGEREQICLREWEEGVSLDNEFRAFVHNGRLNAISQYDHYGVYPHLQAPSTREAVRRLIESLWAELHPRVGVASYCADFCYIPGEGGAPGRARLIELSPFLPCTGPALFSWGADRTVLENGPFEFRINTALRPGLSEVIEANWEDRWGLSGGGAPSPDTAGPATGGYTDIGDVDRYVAELSPYWDYYRAAAPPSPAPSGLRARITARWGRLTGNRAGQSATKATAGDNRLFVYGTLKSGFHWSDKFLGKAGARRVGTASTVDPYPLVVGECGVPYLLMPSIAATAAAASTLDRSETGTVTTASAAPHGTATSLAAPGHCVHGELWEVNDELLLGMDDYEGVTKGYYARVAVPVTVPSRCPEAEGGARQAGNQNHGSSAVTVTAYVYVLTQPSTDLLRQEPLHCYTKSIHAARYNPIRHIMVKQASYLHASSTFADTTT